MPTHFSLAGLLRLLLPALASVASANVLAADNSVAVGASSAWLVRGIALSRTDTVVTFASADAYSVTGWSIGGLVGRFGTPQGQDTPVLNLRGGYETVFDGRWTLLAQWRHLSYPDTDALSTWCYNELGASLADADRWVLSWSAETRRGPICNQHYGPTIVSRSIELNARQPLGGGFQLGAGLGRRMFGGGTGYLYGQAGGAWSGPGGTKWLFDRVWVSAQAKPIYGDIAHDRWVATWLYGF